MRTLVIFLLVLLPRLGMAQAAGDVLRVRIEWLNAQECGIEGCKPQSAIIPSGMPMTFMWPSLPERGVFEIRPTQLKDAIEVKMTRTPKPKNGGAEVAITETLLLQPGVPQEMKLGEIRLMLTAAKAVPPEKKQGQ